MGEEWEDRLDMLLMLRELDVDVVPINFLNRRDELAYVLKQSDSVALVTMDAFRGLDYQGMLDEIAPGWQSQGGGAALPRLREVYVFATGQGTARANAKSLADLESTDDSIPRPSHIDPDTVADILYTSGTTGSPKGAMIAHDSLMRTAYGCAHGRAYEDGHRLVYSLPMHHVFGYVEGLLSVLFVGGAVIPQVVFDPVATLRAVGQHRATDLMAVPTMTGVILETAKNGDFDLSSLAFMISSGGYAPPGQWRQVLDVLKPDELTAGAYGMTETIASTIMVHPEDPLERNDTDGRPKNTGVAGPLAEYRARDLDTGEEVPAGQVGELVVRGAGIITGYYKKPEETAAAFDSEGWFHTGDLGFIDEQGYVTLTGRRKEVYRCGGENVMPKEVEDLLLTYPGVEQAFVVPLPDQKMGEVGVACIVRKSNADVDPEAVRAFCAEHLAKFKVPRHVLFIEPADIPVTVTGRPRKFLLAAKVRERLQPTTS